MLTRYALFEGSIRDGQEAAFRDAVLTTLVPIWKRFPGATALRVSFADSRDDGAPEICMVLATSFPDQATLDAAVASPVRLEARAATEVILAQYYTGRIHHHVTIAHDYTI